MKLPLCSTQRGFSSVLLFDVSHSFILSRSLCQNDCVSLIFLLFTRLCPKFTSSESQGQQCVMHYQYLLLVIELNSDFMSSLGQLFVNCWVVDNHLKALWHVINKSLLKITVTVEGHETFSLRGCLHKSRD